MDTRDEERSEASERDERLRREKEPIGTQEHIPGYGEPPPGVRTLRLPDEAPKRGEGEGEAPR